MKEIIDAIDKAIFDEVGVGKFYGLCKMVIDSNEIYPRTDNNKPEKVTPNDKYPLAIYHRLLNGTIGENEDLSFGRSKTRENSQAIRTIVFIDFKSNVEIESVYDAIPDKIDACDGFKSVWIPSEMSLIVDQDSIWTQELGEAYKDKYQMKYKIYALEYSVEYIKCVTEDVCG